MAEGSPIQKKMVLYSYWRSSCSHRIRIVLHLKDLEFEYKAINLLKGEQFDPEFVKINPMSFVPALLDGDVLVADSFAVALYLEDKYPERPILPQDLQKRALNIQIASIVASSIQPCHSLSVLKFIEEKVGAEAKVPWVQQNIVKGFTAIEKLIQGCAGKYATGDEPQLGDVFLAPQIHAALHRFSIDMSEFPTLERIYDACKEHPAFKAALPENQPDAPSSASE